MVNMLSIKRLFCISLILLLGHATLTLHVATHLPIDQTNCDSCAGYGNPGHAIAPATTELPPPAAFEISFHYDSPVAQSAQLTSYQERAPPARV